MVALPGPISKGRQRARTRGRPYVAILVQPCFPDHREVVMLISKDGTSFVLEEADGFEREATELGNSDVFMKFLEDRSREEGATPIEQYAEELGAKDI